MSNLPPRTYGFWTGVFVVAASMVGSGILMTSGLMLQATQSPWALFGVWLVGGALALAGSLTVAELGAAIPHVGGDYVFVREAFGSCIAFLFGWSCLLFTFSGPIALVSFMTVDYIFPDWSRHDFPTVSVAATVIIIVFTALHSLGQKESAWIQNVTTLVKLLIFVGFAIIGLLAGSGSGDHFQAGAAIAQKGGWSLLAIQLTYVLYAYSGWNAAAYLAGEVRNPERNLPWSLIVGCVLVTILYLLMNAVYVYALSPTSLAHVAESDARKVAWLAGERLFNGDVSRVLSVVFGVGMLATISALLFTAPRIAFMMARDGLAPKRLGGLHPTRFTPIPATVLVGTLSVAMLWSGRFNEVLDFTTVGLTALGGLTVVSIFPLRGRPRWDWTYRMPLYPLPPLLFLSVTLLTVVLAIVESPLAGSLSIAVIASGIPLYFLFRLWAGRTPAPADNTASEKER